MAYYHLATATADFSSLVIQLQNSMTTNQRECYYLVCLFSFVVTEFRNWRRKTMSCTNGTMLFCIVLHTVDFWTLGYGCEIPSFPSTRRTSEKFLYNRKWIYDRLDWFEETLWIPESIIELFLVNILIQQCNECGSYWWLSWFQNV